MARTEVMPMVGLPAAPAGLVQLSGCPAVTARLRRSIVCSPVCAMKPVCSDRSRSAKTAGRPTLICLVPAPQFTAAPELLEARMVVRASVEGAEKVPRPTSQSVPARVT